MKYILLLYTLFIFSCKYKEAENQDKTPIKNSSEQLDLTLSDEQLKNTDIKIAKPIIQEVPQYLKTTGIIDVPPTNMISISCPMGGYLKSTNLIEGKTVKKGDIIAILEDQHYIELQQDYLIASIKLKNLEKDYNRQVALNNVQANSNKTLELITTELEIQKTMVAALGEKLKIINIDPAKLTPQNITKSINLESPIDGYVSKVYLNIGKYLSPSESLFDIINPSDFHLHFQIYQKDLQDIKLGQNFECYLPSAPEKKYYGNIILINKGVQEQTVGVHGKFSNKNSVLLPGTYMITFIKTKVNKAITIPENAVVNFENNHYIFIAKNKNNFQLQKVEVIQNNFSNNVIQIMPIDSVDLLKENIVTNDAFSLLMKLKNKEE